MHSARQKQLGLDDSVPRCPGQNQRDTRRKDMKTGIAWKKTETEACKWSRQQDTPEFEDSLVCETAASLLHIFLGSRNAPASGTSVGGMTPGRVKEPALSSD